MPQRTNYTPQFSSSPFEEQRRQAICDSDDWIEMSEALRLIDEQEDFWWDEEERHTLF